MKYQLLPPLSAEEYGALERSIIEHGVLVPVEYDEAGDIIDGHHRVAICESLGLVDWPKFVRKGLSETEKRALSRELNFARRHLSSAQKQDVIEAQLRDTPSISSRAIAARLGVHHTTVESVRKRLVDGGEISHHEEVEGRDGVKQPARKAIRTAFVPDAPNVREYMKGAKAIRGAQQAERHQVRLAHMELIAKHGAASAPIWWRDGGEGPTYPIIYADPAWRHERWSIETGSEKSAENHYPTMSLDEIVALGCPATKDAALFLWVTDVANGIRVMEAWGFTFKSYWAWLKQYPGAGFGTGYWSFDNLELLLIGTRGDFPAPLPGTQPVKCTGHPVGGHSEKPEFYAAEIERLWPGVPKLEMFRRKGRPGWDVWGFEAASTEAASNAGSLPQGSGHPATDDDLYLRAIEIVFGAENASASHLQRKLEVGYNRAASLLERMQADGLVAAPNLAGKREIIVGEKASRLIEMLAAGLQTGAGKRVILDTLDSMIAAVETPKPKRRAPGSRMVGA